MNRNRLSFFMLAGLAVGGCAGGVGDHHHDEPGAHHPHDDHHDYRPGPFSHAQQTLGHGADRLVLRSVRHAAHHGFHRLVFDVSRSRGEAHHVPRVTATYHEHDFSIDLRIEGVDRDVTGHEVHKPVVVDRAPVARFERHEPHDHHAASYRVQLTRGARYRLHALVEPVRIVLDVEKNDLER